MIGVDRVNIKILYNTMTGNTKKVAEAIAEGLGLEAEKITKETDISDVDLLFIGEGNYAGGGRKSTSLFISKLDKTKVKNIAVFGTYARVSAVNKMKRDLEKQGFNVLDETFQCRGKAWKVIYKSHPNEEDLNNAKKFGKAIVDKL